MGITITLDETVSERVAGISLADLTRYAQEGILSRLEQGGEGGRVSEVSRLINRGMRRPFPPCATRCAKSRKRVSLTRKKKPMST